MPGSSAGPARCAVLVVAMAAMAAAAAGCTSSSAPHPPPSTFSISQPPTSQVIPGLAAASVQARALAALPGSSAAVETFPGSTETSIRVKKPGPLGTHVDIVRHADGQSAGVLCFVLGSASDDPPVADVCTLLPLTGWDGAGARLWLSKIRQLPRPKTSTGIRPAAFTSAGVRLTALYSKTALLLEAFPLPIGASTSAATTSAATTPATTISATTMSVTAGG